MLLTIIAGTSSARCAACAAGSHARCQDQLVSAGCRRLSRQVPCALSTGAEPAGGAAGATGAASRWQGHLDPGRGRGFSDRSRQVGGRQDQGLPPQQRLKRLSDLHGSVFWRLGWFRMGSAAQAIPPAAMSEAPRRLGGWAPRRLGGLAPARFGGFWGLSSAGLPAGKV